jgi:hypothetical protein
MLLMNGTGLLQEVKERLVVDAMQVGVFHAGAVKCRFCHGTSPAARTKAASVRFKT